MGSDLFVGLLEILFKDLDLVLHCANQAVHLGVGLLLQDFLDPSGGCYDFLHGPMSQFLDFSGEGPIQCSQEDVGGVTLGGFLVSGMKSFGEFFRLASKLHCVLGAICQILEGCPGFVSYRADAEAGE